MYGVDRRKFLNNQMVNELTKKNSFATVRYVELNDEKRNKKSEYRYKLMLLVRIKDGSHMMYTLLVNSSYVLCLYNRLSKSKMANMVALAFKYFMILQEPDELKFFVYIPWDISSEINAKGIFVNPKFDQSLEGENWLVFEGCDEWLFNELMLKLKGASVRDIMGFATNDKKVMYDVMVRSERYHIFTNLSSSDIELDYAIGMLSPSNQFFTSNMTSQVRSICYEDILQDLPVRAARAGKLGSVAVRYYIKMYARSVTAIDQLAKVGVLPLEVIDNIFEQMVLDDTAYLEWILTVIENKYSGCIHWMRVLPDVSQWVFKNKNNSVFKLLPMMLRCLRMYTYVCYAVELILNEWKIVMRNSLSI